jgi:hypothetical protein
MRFAMRPESHHQTQRPLELPCTTYTDPHFALVHDPPHKHDRRRLPAGARFVFPVTGLLIARSPCSSIGETAGFPIRTRADGHQLVHCYFCTTSSVSPRSGLLSLCPYSTMLDLPQCISVCSSHDCSRDCATGITRSLAIRDKHEDDG